MTRARTLKEQDRQARRQEWIRKILSRTQYEEETPLYQKAARELEALCDDVLMILSLSGTTSRS